MTGRFAHRAARRDHGVDVGIRKLPLDRVSDQLELVFHDHATGDEMSRRREKVGDRTAAVVRGFGARIADGEDEAAHRCGRCRFVFAVAHFV